MSEEITLKYPVGEIKTVKIRRAKIKDMLSAQSASKNEAEQELFLFELLTGVSRDILKEFDLADYAKLQEVYRSFLTS
jgi:hypothetical protein